MPRKVSLVFNIATDPTQPAYASVHTGGYTESVWDSGVVAIGQLINDIRDLANKRAALLPSSARVIGYRIQEFTIQGNRMIAGGVNSGGLSFPGSSGLDTDIPQAALECRGQSGTSANTRKFVLHNIPDEVFVHGEYQPSVPFAVAVNEYLQELISSAWFFPGRVLSNPNYRIFSIAAGVMTLENTAGINNNDFVRILRCRDVGGKPVVGVFRVVGAPVNNQVTLADFPLTTVVGNSGRARKDEVNIFPFGNGTTYTRAVSRKIGSPLERYRGRRSKRR